MRESLQTVPDADEATRADRFCENQEVFAETPADQWDCTVRIIEGGVLWAKCPYKSADEAVNGRPQDDGASRKYACMDFRPLAES